MPESQWKSINEPPVETGWYIVYAGNYGALGWNADTKQWEDWTHAAAHNIIIDDITHWRDWPAPP